MKIVAKLKAAARAILPDAYCVKSKDPYLKGFIVWPGRCQPRGFERAAIGFGTTAAKAWAEALITISATNDLTLPYKSPQKACRPE